MPELHEGHVHADGRVIVTQVPPDFEDVHEFAEELLHQEAAPVVEFEEDGVTYEMRYRGFFRKRVEVRPRA